VDADDAHRAALKRHLDPFYTVAEARDGMEAVELAPVLPNLCLVVTEVATPRVDGFTLVKIFRANSMLKRVPIVVVSSRDTPQDVTQALSLGVSQYIQKKTPALQIVEKIRKIVD
jgi:CheY-like chemotaxis protein